MYWYLLVPACVLSLLTTLCLGFLPRVGILEFIDKHPWLTMSLVVCTLPVMSMLFLVWWEQVNPLFLSCLYPPLFHHLLSYLCFFLPCVVGAGDLPPSNPHIYPSFIPHTLAYIYIYIYLILALFNYLICLIYLMRMSCMVWRWYGDGMMWSSGIGT